MKKGKETGRSGRNRKKQEERGKKEGNWGETGRNGRKSEQTETNGIKQEELGRHGKKLLIQAYSSPFQTTSVPLSVNSFNGNVRHDKSRISKPPCTI